MKHLFFGFIIFAALITYALRLVQSQSTTGCTSQPRKELVLTVTDKTGNVIDSLRAEHLSLKVGGSNATIFHVAFRNNDQPLDLVVLIDASVSQESVLPLAKVGARSFINSVATDGRDRVAIVSFSNKPITNAVLTADFSVVAAAIEQIKIDKPTGYIGGGVVVSTRPPKKLDIPGSTSLWDAIQNTTQALFGAKPEKRRRAMLVFSDGNDTSSSTTLNAAIEEATKQDITLFSIGLAGPNFSVTEKELKKLSEQTGGVASFPKTKEAFETALTDIAKRLRANYVIGYCGELKGKVQVELADPELKKAKLVLAYRKYVSQ